MNIPIKEHNALKRIMMKQKDRIDELEKQLSDKSDKLDRNTIIITALANYYDYNDLPKEEGREVLKIIMDIQKQNRYERKQR